MARAKVFAPLAENGIINQNCYHGNQENEWVTGREKWHDAIGGRVPAKLWHWGKETGGEEPVGYVRSVSPTSFASEGFKSPNGF